MFKIQAKAITMDSGQLEPNSFFPICGTACSTTMVAYHSNFGEFLRHVLSISNTALRETT